MELENPNAADYAEIPFEDRETYALSETLTVNLTKEAGDNKNHYAHVTATLVLNKSSESYATIQPLLLSYEPIIKSIIIGKQFSHIPVVQSIILFPHLISIKSLSTNPALLT